jgi:FkbM family methyltransferase
MAVDHNDTMRLAILKYGAFKLPCDLREHLQRQFYFFGTYFAEEQNLSQWQCYASGAKVIFDIGANLGIYSFAALAAAPDATVHAFEATPEIASRLREAAVFNNLRRLHVHAVAASSCAGFAKLNRCRSETGYNDGMNFISNGTDETDSSCVPTIRLDDFCEEYAIDRIDLLKIDVQGHEADVLRGAEGLISAGRVGVIMFELNWSNDSQRQCPARQSVRLLERYGYLFSNPGRAPRWCRSGNWMNALSDVIARQCSEG